MSGGVDSSVAAALLRRAGLRRRRRDDAPVDRSDPDARTGRRQCCGVEDVDDARAVAQRLGIPHYTLEPRAAVQRAASSTTSSMSTRSGRTPNPCLACNEHIKFRALLDRALALDADYFATGHYARRVERRRQRRAAARAAIRTRTSPTCCTRSGRRELRRMLFPLGELLQGGGACAGARASGCRVTDKPDSVEICFVPGQRLSRVRRRARSRPQPGAIVDEQRRRRRASTAASSTSPSASARGWALFGERRFVTAIRPEDNVVVIGPEDALLTTTLYADDLRWTQGAPPAPTIAASRENPLPQIALPARQWSADGDRATVTFERPAAGRHARAGRRLLSRRRGRWRRHASAQRPPSAASSGRAAPRKARLARWARSRYLNRPLSRPSHACSRTRR